VALVLEAVSGWAPVIDVALDVCVITLAYYTAYRIRFNDRDFLHFFPIFIRSLPVVMATAVVSLWWAGAYRGIWKFFGARDALVLLKAVALATICSITAVSYLFRFEGYSRAVFGIYAGLAYLLLVAGRASFRFVHELTGVGAGSGRRVVIYGVGDNGLAVLRDTRSDRLAVHVIGFIDDDPATHARILQGVRVLGGLDTLLGLITRREIEGVLVSSAKITRDRLQQLGPACRDHGVFLVQFRWGFQNLLAGQAPVAANGHSSETDKAEVFSAPGW
jgi:UDP-GlcNAc:undecaprenyl-phosphate/decaprenyl-phosphate GlcNAc-1-phosphate transferase